MARSAGTSAKARIKVNQKLLDWADVIFVMERKHKQIISERFEISKPMVVLDIPDDYRFNDPELVEMLTSFLEEYL